MNSLVAYRSTVLTPDAAEAMRQLELAGAEKGGFRIRYRGVSDTLASWKGVARDPGPLGLPAGLSMRPTGREVYLSLEPTEGEISGLERLAALWSIAIPLGFVPWSRFPVPGEYDEVFHYFGPWGRISDFLQGEGRGEFAWPSMCAAAQCEVGRWAGPKKTERLIQTHLHRLGIHCGPVDGVMGDRTLASLRALGFGGIPAEQLPAALSKLKGPAVAESVPQSGYFTMKGGSSVEPFCSGGVHAARTPTGISVDVTGPGRLILLFGGYRS